MEVAVCNTELFLENKKKKQKKHKTFEDNHRDRVPYEGCASKDTAAPQKSPVKICLNLEPEVGRPHPEVILLREKKKRRKKKHNNLQKGEVSGIPVLNVSNTELVKKDETSVSPNADLCSTEGKEASLVSGEPDGKETNVIKGDDGHTETIDHLAQPSHVDLQRIKTRKRRRRRRKSVESPKRTLESNGEDSEKISLVGCPHEEKMSSHLKKNSTAEAVDGVPLKEVSLDCSVGEKAELCNGNTKRSSVAFADPHGSVDGEKTTMIRKDNDCSKTEDCLPQPCRHDTLGLTQRERKKGRRKRKFADSLEESLEPEVEDGKNNTPLNCLNDVETTSLHEHASKTVVAKNVLLEEVSSNWSTGKLSSNIKERVDTDLSCKLLEEEFKMQTKKQKVPHGATNDDVGSILENSSCSQISNSHKEIDAIGCSNSKKKLLILDVNGLLVDFVPYIPDEHTPDFIISRKAVFKRPFCDDFLQFCFERFEVGIWSSRTWKNLNMLVKFLMRDSRHKLLFCWDQSHCTTTGFTTVDNNKKPLVLKELKKIWENLEPNLPWKKGEYDESNTLLLDDSPYKALRNPANTAVFPISFQYKDSEDASLGPGGDLRVYLEGLSMADNVQKYVEQYPFGQRPISESNASWTFYSKIINSEER